MSAAADKKKKFTESNYRGEAAHQSDGLSRGPPKRHWAEYDRRSLCASLAPGDQPGIISSPVAPQTVLRRVPHLSSRLWDASERMAVVDVARRVRPGHVAAADEGDTEEEQDVEVGGRVLLEQNLRSEWIHTAPDAKVIIEFFFRCCCCC